MGDIIHLILLNLDILNTGTRKTALFSAMLGLHIVALVPVIRESFLFILKRFFKFLNHVSPRSFPSFSEELGLMKLAQAAMDCLLEEEFKSAAWLH